MRIFIYFLPLIFSTVVYAQTTTYERDSVMLRKIHDQALVNGKSYSWLEHLTTQIGNRLSGSAGAEKAVVYTKEELEKLGLDKVFLQEVMVPKWIRGIKEYAYIETESGNTIVTNILALGGSTSTPVGGLKAGIVEVQDFEDLEKLGREKIEGKIVFYNKPMEPRHIQTFTAYGGCSHIRYSGAKEAAKYGAVGVIVRSLTHSLDDYPHTGVMSYGDLPMDKYIPAAAISTKGAEMLSSMLKLQPKLKFYFNQTSYMMPDVLSHNVVGEIKGSQYPDQYIVVGGHLDSWDVGQGAHDDGAGCVQAMEVLRIFKDLNYQPKHTIRVVLFMNEENGTKGG